MQMSEMETALRQTQTSFLAIKRSDTTMTFTTDDGLNLTRRRVNDAEPEGSLRYIASTFDPYDQVIRPGVYEGGRKIISMNGVLEQEVFPFPELMQMALQLGSDEMRRPVEIEMACNIHPPHDGEEGSLSFYLLQIRPIVDTKQELNEDLLEIPDEQCLLRSHNSLGHGVVEGLQDVVYVKVDDDYSPSNNGMIQDEIDSINDAFLAAQANPHIDSQSDSHPSSLTHHPDSYILIGPGRWGSSDEWLGIPVKWPNISAARLIVEEILPSHYVDPSQGTHFFQNLTSLGVGYFTIDVYHDRNGNPISDREAYGNGELEILRRDVLDKLPAVRETKHVRHVRLPHPVTLMMDGLKQKGVVVMENE
jgi:hypothetical protein